MENTYNLEPRFDNRKSFYGKAIVEIIDKAGESKLYSYNTHVATFKAGVKKSDDVLIINGYFSATTMRHINEFIQQLGYKKMTKKQVEGLAGKEIKKK
jgi:hypothetical protein